MSSPSPEMVELFLQEAGEHLQFLREYSGILQDPYPAPEDIERLYISAHGLSGTSATYGYALFSEVVSKVAHIFQYAMNAMISADAGGPLVEFVYEAIAVLETDLLMVSANAVEAEEDITAFKQRYPFAFQVPSPSRAEAPAEPKQEPAPAAPVQRLAPSPTPAQTPAPVAASEQLVTATPTPLQALASTPVPAQLAQPAVVVNPVVDTDDEPLFTLSAEPPIDISSIPDIPKDGELPDEILEFFVPEVEEHLQTVTECLLNLEANPSQDEIHRLFRAMHTVKGSAAQVGLHRISTVGHRAEDLIGRLRDGLLRPNARIVDLCFESVDILKKLLYRQWTDENAFQTAAKTVIAQINRLVPMEEDDAEITSTPPATEPVVEAVPTTAVAAPVLEVKPEAAIEPLAKVLEHIESEEKEEPIVGAIRRDSPVGVPQSKSVRIALERLDRMMNAVGSLVINRTRMIGRLAELEKLADVLNFSKARMIDKVSEFQEKYEFSKIHRGSRNAPGHYAPQFPSLGDESSGFGGTAFRGGFSGLPQHDTEFSELEMDRYDDFGILSRSLTEISADIAEVLTQVDGFVRRVDGDIDEFTKLAHRLQDEITQARMVPIGNLYTRISRTVRDAAKASNKQVDLKLSGAETELDNNIIQQIADPLLHLVRNSVAHGIERNEERYELGKADIGSITVSAYHRGNHIYVEVEDDGRGIDYERVRQSAIDNGHLSPDQAERLTERDLLELLFRPGFSTASRKTELAGRGVGLDVVRSNIQALNGEIEIETQKGIGTRFTLKVPLTLIISQALFVRCGENVFAMPLAFVEEVRRIRDTDIEDVGGKLLTKIRDVVTEVIRLDTQLGLPSAESVNGWYRLVMVNVAGREVGIIVEEVLRKDEIVIKNLGEYLHNVKMFPGATIASDGSLILLVDVNRLIIGDAIEHRPLTTSANAARIFAPGALAVASGEIPAAAIDIVEREKVVVLADDSISVRKFVGRMLEKAGYRVRLASDGMEALEIVSQMPCDLVVTDLEMPRTNGYELMLHLRQDAELRRIPVMVVTSRAGAKHRDRAMKEGAAAFMVKPVQEEQFIAQIRQLIGSSGQIMAASTVR